MNCSQCHKEFQPAPCAHCGAPLSPLCPACGPSLPNTCPNCGQATTSFPAASAPSAGPMPHAAPFQAGPHAGGPPPRDIPPMGVPAWNPYLGRPIPTKKVPLGGWLMLFFVFTCIGLGCNLIGLLFSTMAASFSIFALLINLVFGILPAVMITVLIVQRDIKFKYWYYFTAAVSFLSAALLVVGSLLVGTLLRSQPGMLNTALAAAGYESDIFSSTLPADFMRIVTLSTIVGAVIALGIIIAWWVYFNKSRRVIYTFNPLNNPPK